MRGILLVEERTLCNIFFLENAVNVYLMPKYTELVPWALVLRTTAGI